MLPSEQLVDDLADAILDGTPIDWAAAESSPDGTARPLVSQLRVLAAVADAPSRYHAERPSTLSRDHRRPAWSRRLRTRLCCGVIFGSSSGSAGARSERCTAPGIRGLIAKSR